MEVQLIDRKNIIFRVGNSEYQFVKPKFLYKNNNTRLEAKVKGSTMGWYIENQFFTYNKLKQLLK